MLIRSLVSNAGQSIAGLKLAILPNCSGEEPRRGEVGMLTEA